MSISEHVERARAGNRPRPRHKRTACCCRPTSLRSSSAPRCCLRCSRCSPRWCCRGSAARPSVWSVAMVFFQTTLLAGYAYAHLLTRFAPGRTSVIIHLVVMVAACFFAAAAHRDAAGARRRKSARRSGCSACSRCRSGCRSSRSSANGPLLQAWFVRTGHPRRARIRIFSMPRAMSEASWR